MTHARSRAMTAFLLCLPIGCQTLSREQALDGPQAARSQPELPPAEASRLCFKTAQELEKAGKLPEAIALYEKSRALNPRQPQISRRLAVLYDLIGNPERATAEFELALQAAPKDPDLLSDLGYSYYCRGRWNEAETCLRQALAVNPKHGRASVNLGMTLAQQDRRQEALEAFNRVVSPAQSYSNLAFILTAQGKREDAKLAYRKAVSLDPSLRIAQAALAKLQRADAKLERADAQPTTSSQPTTSTRSQTPRSDLVLQPTSGISPRATRHDEPIYVSPE